MKKILLSAVVLTAMTGSAMAADIIYTPPPVAPPPPAPVGFDWSGPYAGIYGGYIFGLGLGEAGVAVGYNFVGSGSLLFGIEGQVGAAFAGGVVFEAEASARVGAIVGAEDRAVLYAEAGVGTIGGGLLFSAGGGIEFAVGDSASIFVEGGCVFVGACAPQVQAGVNFHFGR